jgi:hypothetical protein
MVRGTQTCLAGILAAVLCTACGCQFYKSGEEIRSDEQMLPISFENARAKEFFMKAVQTTYGEEKNVKRLGSRRLSLYSHSETIAWNANCNDHIRRMDRDENLVITEQEAESYYNAITSGEGQAGRVLPTP